MDPRLKKGASGVDSDTLRRKIAHPLSEDRAACKKVRNELKYGMSKESPFLSNQPHQLVHPSTKIIFGEPEKKPRPFTSKVNTMFRKTLLEGRRNLNKDYKIDPAFKNSFTQFARCSQSPEKQKLMSFYNNSCTLKGLKKQMAEGIA